MNYQHHILIWLFFLCLSANVFSQGIKGTVTDENANPLSFCTIFISQTGSGTVTNENGVFEIDLASGSYTIVFQYLGYETLQKQFKIGQATLTEEIVLQPQEFKLETIEVMGSDEDPAYSIMRRAIAKADYHRQQLDAYTARVYVKGAGRVKDVPWLLRRQMKKQGIDSTKAFLVESLSEVSYQRPNKFDEKVISIRKQGNENAASPAPYINSSFYQPEVVEAVSPLSPRAFTYYEFDWLGSFSERGVTVNKIAVNPRNNGEGVFKGIIYIVEDWWNIHSLELSTYKLGFRFDLNQIYAPIEEKVWLPVTFNIGVEGSIMGIDLEYNYLATVSNYKITVNPELDADFRVIDEKIEKELAAKVEKERPKRKKSALEQKLQSGDKLTRRELRKVMKEYEKEDRKKQKEPEVKSSRTFKIDSAAQIRDSVFWDSIRPMPLTQLEVNAYKFVDSVAIDRKEKVTKDSIQKNSPLGKIFGSIFFGNSFSLSRNTRFILAPPLLNSSYHATDLWNTKFPFSVRTKIDTFQQFSLTATPRWLYNQRRVDGSFGMSYSLGKPFRKMRISAKAGEGTFQFSPQDPIDLLMEDTYYILFEQRNLGRFYKKRFANLRLSHQASDYLRWNAAFEWAQRDNLQTHPKLRSWINWNREFATNIPDNVEAFTTVVPEQNEAQTLYLGASWFPYLTYLKRNGVKMAGGNNGPVFKVDYRKAFGNGSDDEVAYDFLKAGVHLDYEMPAGTRLRSIVRGGMFFNKSNVYFPDYHHFRGNLTTVVLEEPVGNFRIMDYYQNSTQDKFLEAHAHGTFRQLALTQIPELWMVGLKENLFASYLTTPKAGHYLEVGYGLDNIYKFFRVEVAASFLNGKYNGWGVMFGVASGFNFGMSQDDDETEVRL